MEVWKDVKGYEKLYEVSNYGNVRSLNYNGTKKVVLLKPQETIHGYFMVQLYKNGISKKFQVHRLVMISFVENTKNKPCVNHKNGIKTDNRLENLEWVTYSENEKHSHHILGKKYYQPMKGMFGLNHNRSNPVVQISLDGFIIADYDSRKEAFDKTGISQSNISLCVSGKRKKAGGYIWK